MRQEAGSFYRINNEEQGRKKQKMKREEGHEYRAQSCLGIWRLADWIQADLETLLVGFQTIMIKQVSR